jgi:hypothetical protein
MIALWLQTRHRLERAHVTGRSASIVASMEALKADGLRVSRFSRRRALAKLERAGLARVKLSGRHAPIVTVLPLPSSFFYDKP